MCRGRHNLKRVAWDPSRRAINFSAQHLRSFATRGQRCGCEYRRVAGCQKINRDAALAEFLVQPMTTIVTSPNLAADKPTGNCASRDDHGP
jgi:hypothetical protein